MRGQVRSGRVGLGGDGSGGDGSGGDGLGIDGSGGDGSVGNGSGGDRSGEDGSGGDGLGQNWLVGDGLVGNGSVVKKFAAEPPSFNWFGLKMNTCRPSVQIDMFKAFPIELALNESVNMQTFVQNLYNVDQISLILNKTQQIR